MEERENTNSIIEATLNAPGMGAGSKRGESRRAAAAQAVEATGERRKLLPRYCLQQIRFVPESPPLPQ